MLNHKGRNVTTHVYDFEKAELIYQITGDFVHDALALLRPFEARNN